MTIPIGHVRRQPADLVCPQTNRRGRKVALEVEIGRLAGQLPLRRKFSRPTFAFPLRHLRHRPLKPDREVDRLPLLHLPRHPKRLRARAGLKIFNLDPPRKKSEGGLHLVDLPLHPSDGYLPRFSRQRKGKPVHRQVRLNDPIETTERECPHRLRDHRLGVLVVVPVLNGPALDLDPTDDRPLFCVGNGEERFFA